jgi:hypothetical protein
MRTQRDVVDLDALQLVGLADDEAFTRNKRKAARL